jgi:PncC family amidohydrolase
LNAKILEKAELLVSLLKEKNLKIATAESCTGGLVSAYLTCISGASQVFEMGVTSYSNEVKNRILGVGCDTLKEFGAVSQNTACEMAQSVRKMANADIGVSVTGVAGPTSQEGHPVGYVFIGVSYKENTFATLLDIPPRDREYVRKQAVLQLFDTVITTITQNFHKEN